MGVGESSGSSAAYEAIKSAIESPLFDNMSIQGAMGILVHFYIHPEYPLTEISESMDVIYDSTDEDADVIFGTTTDENMEIDKVKITIVATGFEKELITKTPSDNNSNSLNQRIKEPRVMKLKVSGGNDEEYYDVLDVPTYIRKQMD